MKKIISIVTVALFLVAYSGPAFGDKPPKARTETDSCKSKKCDKEKCSQKCSEKKGKGDATAKCSGDKKAGCCKEKSATPQTK